MPYLLLLFPIITMCASPVSPVTNQGLYFHEILNTLSLVLTKRTTSFMDYSNVKSKAVQYQKVIENTTRYREEWNDTTRKMLEEQLEAIIQETGLKATIEHKDDLNNLQAMALSLGQAASGISEQVGEAERQLIKSRGMLVYQQLFNGKLMVSVMYPFIEGLGQPKPPKMIEILRPEELKEAYVLRHTEEFLKEIISWEDYDDDMPTQPIGFQTNFDRDNLIQSMEKS